MDTPQPSPMLWIMARALPDWHLEPKPPSGAPWVLTLPGAVLAHLPHPEQLNAAALAASWHRVSPSPIPPCWHGCGGGVGVSGRPPAAGLARLRSPWPLARTGC